MKAAWTTQTEVSWQQLTGDILTEASRLLAEARVLKSEVQALRDELAETTVESRVALSASVRSRAALTRERSQEARAAAADADSPHRIRAEAVRMLATIGPDPDAALHRAVLEQALADTWGTR